MKITELEKKLIEAKIPRNAYNLMPEGFNTIDSFEDDGLYLKRRYKSTSWEVYYSERGYKWNRKIFLSEDDACEYFYNLIMH